MLFRGGSHKVDPNVPACKKDNNLKYQWDVHFNSIAKQSKKVLRKNNVRYRVDNVIWFPNTYPPDSDLFELRT